MRDSLPGLWVFTATDRIQMGWPLNFYRLEIMLFALRVHGDEKIRIRFFLKIHHNGFN
ncbi:hypothetical protein [Acidihalobacter ferrooxydans]|uniref:hypothetical protein n=1 Tax=Acidihalobacter ferrooxydans TaxID=1765967 RepID=UPI0012EC6214|nr:hypothetical protein [Acidihalobacter ferrooxydans]